MRETKERSIFLPLLILGATLVALVVLACSVPIFECRFEENGGWISRAGRHGRYLNRDGGQYFWACRTCEGDFKATLLKFMFDPEAGRPNPPPDAGFVPASAEWIPTTLPGFKMGSTP